MSSLNASASGSKCANAEVDGYIHNVSDIRVARDSILRLQRPRKRTTNACCLLLPGKEIDAERKRAIAITSNLGKRQSPKAQV